MKLLQCAALGAAAFVMAQPAAAMIADKPAPEAKEDPAKFFLFHAEGTTKDQARGDLSYCIGQSRDILSMRDRMPSGGGLLGGMINARMAEIDRFRMRNAAMRKCMGMMGYNRYVVPEANWKVIVNEGDIVLGDKNLPEAEVIERMVDFATGQVPAGERLDR